MLRAATYEELLHVAHKAVRIFKQNDLRCCLIGSAACSLWGTTRLPGDVDLVVFTTTYNQEELKDVLTDADDAFYTVPSQRRDAAYEVLYHFLPITDDNDTADSGEEDTSGSDSDTVEPHSEDTDDDAEQDEGEQDEEDADAEEDEGRCKVDILTPGICSTPHVPRAHVARRARLPVMPLIPLILLKLRGWTDHRDSNRRDFQDKVPNDVQDIDELLEIACEMGVRLTHDDALWLPDGFVEEAQERIDAYLEEFPNSSLYWYTTGLVLSRLDRERDKVWVL
ncbi:hypothetical protein B0H21DRAFT_730005 [Amylocystis lapponica]|nr:hypothetical protein B0H21DRAFT_730005 [Amylocystis lapponica]